MKVFSSSPALGKGRNTQQTLHIPIAQGLIIWGNIVSSLQDEVETLRGRWFQQLERRMKLIIFSKVFLPGVSIIS